MSKSSRREHLMLHAPITYEMAAKAYGHEPFINLDPERAAFFAVWAFLAAEWADAMLAEIERRNAP